MMACTDKVLLRWPLMAVLASAVMLAIAHAFERIGGLAPCNLCLRQREVFWAIMGVSAGILVLSRFAESRSLKPWGNGLIAAMFLFSAGLAFFHAGVEWKWWPGPASCSGGSGMPTAADLMAALDGARIAPPSCDRAAWMFAGLSMAGWNAVISLGLAAVSALAAWRVAKVNRA